MNKEAYRKKKLAEARAEREKFLDIIRKDPQAALQLIDGAYEIVEIHPPGGPAGVKWKKEWLAAARYMGASPSWG